LRGGKPGTGGNGENIRAMEYSNVDSKIKAQYKPLRLLVGGLGKKKQASMRKGKCAEFCPVVTQTVRNLRGMEGKGTEGGKIGDKKV